MRYKSISNSWSGKLHLILILEITGKRIFLSFFLLKQDFSQKNLDTKQFIVDKMMSYLNLLKINYYKLPFEGFTVQVS